MANLFSQATKSQLSRILWITIAWTFISTFHFIITYVGLIELERDTSDLHPWIYFKGSLMVGILAGAFGGTFMVLFWEKWLRTRNYGRSLLNILWSYSIIFLLVAVTASIFVSSAENQIPFYDPVLWRTEILGIFDLPTLTSYLFWLIVVLGTLIFLLVNDKYGPGVFLDFLLGRYFKPKREQRIFMFLDLRSSTTIAEKLGEQRYFNFLKDTFQHATPAILNSKGEIYQYVGDEMVISWTMDRGVAEANCINCFFDIKEALRKKENYYRALYDNIVPEFKAGLHYGFVMAGELGVVKREIAFSGDVLNTTARIQEKCNELKVNILLSSDLIERLSGQLHQFSTRKIGEMILRGKQQEIALYTV
ncbi:MAG: hypothetical protein DHS20C17_04750 [Cyclobacteriaceae bacterium]|nr:MAG: hypothetical protein DHS20C17_04750 [Cyclobacteriaceae bacterium]